jgi:DNA-directed RNA polymerase subunit RPC12/RpoP
MTPQPLLCPVCDAEMIQNVDTKGRPYAFCPPCGGRLFVGRPEAKRKWEAKYGTAYKDGAEPAASPAVARKEEPVSVGGEKPAPAAAPAAPPTPPPAPAKPKRKVTFFDD